MWGALAEIVTRFLTALGLYEAGQRQASTSALAASEAETIRIMKEREALDAQINADPDLLSRARRVFHTDAPK